MAKPTAEQVKALEKAHKQALVNLLQAIRFRKLIYSKLGSNSPEWKKYAQLVWDIWRKWYARQLKYEQSGGAVKENIIQTDWNTLEGLKKLQALAKKWDVKGEGVGFIPLIIWAVIAIAGFFTADQIVDELNTTTQEQQELIKSSEEIANKYGFDKEETKKFLTQQTDAVKDEGGGLFGGGIGKTILWAGAGYLLLTNWDKIFKSKTT